MKMQKPRSFRQFGILQIVVSTAIRHHSFSPPFLAKFDTDQMTKKRTVSEARLESVLDTAVDGIVVIDDSGTILAFNKACEVLFGYTAAEVIGENVKMLMPHEYSDHHDQYMHNYLTTGEKKIIGTGREVKGQHKSGRIFHLDLSVGEAATPDSRQFIGIIRDLTARKEDEERIAELQGQLLHMARVSAVDEMGAAIAHELNQPLTAVMLYLQAATRRMGLQESQPDTRTIEIVDKATREARRASDIIQRMRSFIERREPDRKRANLRELVDEAIDLTIIGTRTKNVLLNNVDPDEAPEVEVDTVQIQQIVVNLVRNALEVMRERQDPKLTTLCAVQNGWAILIVEDNGPGIPPASMDTMFRAFSTGKAGGLGLGLAISRSIAQSHGGDLTVDPGGNGRGAAFHLKLPLAPTLQ